jgi:hypothetical protein
VYCNSCCCIFTDEELLMSVCFAFHLFRDPFPFWQRRAASLRNLACPSFVVFTVAHKRSLCYCSSFSG